MVSMIVNTKGKELKDIPVISDYPDVFPEELPGLPQIKRLNLEFT